MAKLDAYRAKRDFEASPEPSGRRRGKAAAPGLAFVVQKHDASRLHYDLRLELDGVMKSWAVAKGPSLVPGEKRLAVHVEDHPIAYNAFEGTIPKGQYGGGTVMIWDHGRWMPNADPERGYKKGHLDFTLDGEKLRGAWHLVRMRKRSGEKQEPWLLIKSEDEAARGADDPDILEEAPLSVTTGRDLDAIAGAGDGAVWQSNRGMAAEARSQRKLPQKADKEAKSQPVGSSGDGERQTKAHIPSPSRGGTDPRVQARGPGGGPSVGAQRMAPHPGPPLRSGSALPARGRVDGVDTSPPDIAALTEGGTKAAFPRAIEPCLTTSVDAPPAGDAWLHEIKWDGYRLIAFRSKAGIRLATRRGHDWTTRFPGIAAALAELAVESVILDGEAIIEGEDGAASFSALQVALSDTHDQVAHDAILVAFDLLYLDGTDLRTLPLEDRKARLATLVPPGSPGALRLGEHIEAEGAAVLRSAKELGLEGIVSKRRDRPYRSGRGTDWLKIKSTDRQEFVVVGFMPSAATPKAVGSLALGYHEGRDLRHVGRAGTGYTAALARDLWAKLDPLRRKSPAVAGRLTADERRGIVWVEPTLVAEIEFRGWTGDDHLRHAAFKGLREDKDPADVVRERPKPMPKSIPGETSKPAGGKAADAPKTGIVRSRHSGTATVAGIGLTHPDRILWPEDGITKQDLAAYYEAVAEHLLPQLVRRPLSLVRCPNGLAGSCFFQKHSWAGLDDSVRRMTVTEETGEQEEILYVEDLPGVISLVQASVMEIHPWGAHVEDVERPDLITMDLDPGPDVAFSAVIEAARDVRERLSAMKLESVVKTTGGKGLHVVVPLSGKAGWAEVKGFAHALAESMARDDPRRYLAKATKADREGRIYVDYLRNGRGATAVAAFSTRARQGATISVPLRWEELTPLLKPWEYTTKTLPKRLDTLKDDPWIDMRDLAQTLPAEPGRRPAKRPRR